MLLCLSCTGCRVVGRACIVLVSLALCSVNVATLGALPREIFDAGFYHFVVIAGRLLGGYFLLPAANLLHVLNKPINRRGVWEVVGWPAGSRRERLKGVCASHAILDVPGNAVAESVEALASLC